MGNKSLRVLLIDPWGTNNTSEYLNGLIYGFSGIVELDVFTNYYFNQYVVSSASVKRIFFRTSEKMKVTKKRTFIRGMEYVFGYYKILKTIKNENYDVVHINWLLNYPLDKFFLKEIKKLCNRVVYTAHNVLPHVNGVSAKQDLKVIYGFVDRIIVHGNSVKDELISLFPETSDKIHIQKHGCVLKAPVKASFDKRNAGLAEKINSYNKVFLCCGAVFFNKGIDRLIEIWIENYKDADALLIVGGRQMECYPEYEAQKKIINEIENIVLFDGFIEDRVMDALFDSCTVVVLPYRHASMSGVVFSAAQFSKPIICTQVGALPEYLEDNQDSFLCDNSQEGLKSAMDKTMETNMTDLKKMGENLHNNISKKCDWKTICKGLYTKVYR